MRVFIFLFFVGSLWGCQSQSIEGLGKANASSESSDAYLADPIMDGHSFRCLDENKDRANQILYKIKERKDLDGVVFYFHGGLSDRDYVNNKLGPVLMRSIFSKEVLGDHYPVFINYDAGFSVWKNMEAQINSLVKEASFKRAQRKFRNKIEKDILRYLGAGFVGGENSPEIKLGRDYIDSALVSAGKISEFAIRSDEEREEIYRDLLRDDKLAEDVERKLISKQKDFVDIQKNLENVKSSEEQLVGYRATKVIVRTLARFALGTYHDIVPTFQEEAFKVYKIGGISIHSSAKKHWSMVKKNSKNCFSEGLAGRHFVDNLLNMDLKIHTISHSAGSIPSGFLLEHLRERGKIVESMSLIVPAINQHDFADLFIDNHKAAKRIQGYILGEDQERTDSIAFGLYPASLLYFVSGVAEEAWYGDQMLLIEQHLNKKRKIYEKTWFQGLTKEQPDRVWAFMEREKENWFFYPSASFKYEYSHYKKRASHECTKYPWVSMEVAKKIVMGITGNRPDNIPIPDQPVNYVKTVRKNCS